jgi:predicted transposase/invertase (TIGR01784 family)
MDAAPLLDPKNDAVFKRLFAGAPHLLAELINAVRSSEPPLTVVEILNPDITPEDLSGKQIILDILARDPEGKLYNVEMQVRAHRAWTARSAFYLARAFTG